MTTNPVSEEVKHIISILSSELSRELINDNIHSYEIRKEFVLDHIETIRLYDLNRLLGITIIITRLLRESKIISYSYYMTLDHVDVKKHCYIHDLQSIVRCLIDKVKNTETIGVK